MVGNPTHAGILPRLDSPRFSMFASRFRGLLILSLLVTLSACASGSSFTTAPLPPADARRAAPVRTTATGIAGTVDYSDIQAASDALFGEDAFDGGIPTWLESEVQRYVDAFSSEEGLKKSFARWLAQKGRFEDLIARELGRADLPDELIYLALIESGYSPNAVSRAKAVGLWQFMAPTAGELGLRIDEWVDERRDPIRSTEAAVAYLAYLRGVLDSWPLAVAAYNGGQGRVKRAIEAASTRDLGALVEGGFLPQETAAYVPKILAAAVIGRDPGRYGFAPVVPDPAYRYDEVRVEGLVRLEAIAQAAGTDVETLKSLNPHLVNGATPPDTEGYSVRVPVGTPAQATLAALESMSPQEVYVPRESTRIADYVVRSGDSWWKIANDHGMTLADIRKINPGIGDRIYPGMTVNIRVPVTLYGDAVIAADESHAAQSTSARSEQTRPAFSGPVTVTAETDTASLGCIADCGEETRLVAPIEDSAEANSLVERLQAALADAEGSEARAAQRETASAGDDAGAFHTVTRGESMIGLARRYGITVAQLMEWNGIAKERYLYVGERLRVRPVEQFHIVAAGENLTMIARRYGLTVQQLAEWNRIVNPNHVFRGRRLRLTAPE